MKDKLGNEITAKEFFRKWKEGMQKITPFQQTKIILFGNVLVVIGIIIGLITTFLIQVWWLFIILCGSFFLTGMGFLAALQKYWVLKKINEEIEEIEENEKSTG